MRPQSALAALIAALALPAHAGPADPSRFDPTPYVAQKALYDFNFAKPQDAKPAFGYLKNHLQAIKQYGDPKNSHLVIPKWQNQGYSYMYAEWFPRLTRDEVVKQHPELQ